MVFILRLSLLGEGEEGLIKMQKTLHSLFFTAEIRKALRCIRQLVRLSRVGLYAKSLEVKLSIR